MAPSFLFAGLPVIFFLAHLSSCCQVPIQCCVVFQSEHTAGILNLKIKSLLQS